MIRNYLITAVRTFNKHRIYSAINVLGLSLGLASSFFIVLWIQDELSYDRFHAESDQLYQVKQHQTFSGEIRTNTLIPKPLDDVLGDNYPEITHAILSDWEATMVLRQGEQVFRATGRYFDSEVFEVFSFPLIVGNAVTVLDNPESIAISASLAERFFGPRWRSRDDIIGTSFRIDNRLDVSLTGVFQDVPANSSLKFDFVLPMEEYIRRNDWVDRWGTNSFLLFVRLEKGTNAEQLSEKISNVINEHVDRWRSEVFLQPLADTYLWSEYEGGVPVGGRIDYVRIFLLVALFIILIAGINFMNLSTARSSQRTREIGVRKSLGASRWFLVRQFMSESILTALLAYLIAMTLVFVLLPQFNALTGKSIELSFLDGSLWLRFGGLSLLTGVIAGIYPACYLSSFNVTEVFRSSQHKNARGAGLRKGLVVFQFMMSIILIIGTVTVYRQLSFIRDKDLGIDRNNVLYMDFEGRIREQFDSFKQELFKEPGIINLATTNVHPMWIYHNTTSATWEGKDPDDNTLYGILNTSYDLIETMQMGLIDGRLFSPEFGADSTNYIINERAAETMGMNEPIGRTLELWGETGQIIGVVKDFHMKSLYEPIEPVIFRLSPEDSGLLYIRIAEGESQQALAALERVYEAFNPGYPFSYRFLDDRYEEMYRSEVVIGKLTNIFSLLAIVIACLGLFGLASFTAEKRTKEIGIRKVLGASVSNVVYLLLKEFIILVALAFTGAAPIAYFLMDNWLNAFTFHIDLGLFTFLIAGLGATFVAWMTIGYQTIRAATANPVVSLRSE